MQPYFSQNYHKHDPIYDAKKQVLFVRLVDFMPYSNFNAETELKFTVCFSNHNETNVPVPISQKYDSNGDERETNNIKNSLNIPHYEEVSKVELKGISFPYLEDDINYGSEETEKKHVCFALDIPEFNGRIHSSVNQLHETFAIIYFDTTSATGGVVKPLKGTDFEEKIYIPSQPIKRLNKFTVIFRNGDGEIIKAKDLVNSYDKRNVIKILHQITLLFEFTIKV